MENEKRLIDANALVDALHEKEYSLLCPLDEVSEVVNDAPTVDTVEVVHGRWNEINQNSTGLPWKYRCNECGCPQDYKHNYCPNCGAKMDKEA